MERVPTFRVMKRPPAFPVMKRVRALALAAAIAFSALSCATGAYVPATSSMPAARAGLRPEYRFFYDALADYGEWTLIEPWGWVFRPHVNQVAWRPYREGFWVPSDYYGWTWVSTEPFGWATYHYGDWAYDSYQGWVWIPGIDWGPAWVDWGAGDGYIGWAPLGPVGGNWDTVPGGPFLYVPMAQLPATDLSTLVQKASDLRGKLGDMEPVENPAEHQGVRFNRGPRFDMIERSTGQPLARVKLEDHGPLAPGAGAHAKPLPPGRAPADTIAAVRRAAEEATSEARGIAASKSGAPPQLRVLRPLKPRLEKPAPPDSTP